MNVSERIGAHDYHKPLRRLTHFLQVTVDDGFPCKQCRITPVRPTGVRLYQYDNRVAEKPPNNQLHRSVNGGAALAVAAR